MLVDYPLLLVSFLLTAFSFSPSQAKLSKSGKEKLQLRIHSEPEQSHEEVTQVTTTLSVTPGDIVSQDYDGLPGELEYDIDLSDQENTAGDAQETADNSVG